MKGKKQLFGKTLQWEWKPDSCFFPNKTHSHGVNQVATYCKYAIISAQGVQLNSNC